MRRSGGPFRGGQPRVLLVGYNGANNTGAEALLLTDLEDLRSVLGPAARLTWCSTVLPPVEA